MEPFELKSDYWEFIDGHGKEPDVDYEQLSLGRLIIAHPFLNACPHYIEFLKLHIEAKLRERNGQELANKSLGSRLPKWMNSKKNREPLLKSLTELQYKK